MFIYYIIDIYISSIWRRINNKRDKYGKIKKKNKEEIYFGELIVYIVLVNVIF